MKNLSLEVVSVTVVRTRGPDKVLITCKGPSPIWPFDADTFCLSLDVVSGNGQKYVQEQFGIEAEVVQG
jgi:hypothetical protein